MNFISPRGVCVAYPATFFNRVAMPTMRTAAGEDTARLQKYVNRGYVFIKDATKYWGDMTGLTCRPQGYCASALCWFGDNNSLVIPFGEKKGMEPDLFTPIIPTTIAWQWGGSGCHPGCTGLQEGLQFQVRSQDLSQSTVAQFPW